MFDYARDHDFAMFLERALALFLATLLVVGVVHIYYHFKNRKS
jgi:hypothetical protein